MSIDQTKHDTAATPSGAVVETIATYDADAEAYGQRFANADFGTYLTRFMDALPIRTPVLDAGCGSGRDLAWLTEHGVDAIGLDRSQGMLSVASRTAPGAGLVQGDLRRLPFDSSTFGGVWHCAALLHLKVEDAVLAIREVWRVLVPSGIVFLSVASGNGSEWHNGSAGRRWFQYYNNAELDRIVQSVGMEVQSSATESGVVRGTWINILAKKLP